MSLSSGVILKQSGTQSIARREGFWGTSDDHDLPDPRRHVEHEWPARGAFLITLAAAEHDAKRTLSRGRSTCRCCGQGNGSATYSLGGWEWPSGFAHYVEKHGVRPSLAFEEFVRGYRADGAKKREPDQRGSQTLRVHLLDAQPGPDTFTRCGFPVEGPHLTEAEVETRVLLPPRAGRTQVTRALRRATCRVCRALLEKDAESASAEENRETGYYWVLARDEKVLALWRRGEWSVDGVSTKPCPVTRVLSARLTPPDDTPTSTSGEPT